MAEPEEPLSQAAVLRFLRAHGGQVRNSALVSRFKPLLEAPVVGGGGGAAAPEARAALRERFKRFVNAVAVVRERDGARFVVLRKKYRLAPAEPEEEEEPRVQEEEEEEEEEEEGGGGSGPWTSALRGEPGAPPLPPEREAYEEPREALPVAQLKSLFQRGEGEVPRPLCSAPREAPLKPCMLPVRCVPPLSSAKELSPQEQQQPRAKDGLPTGSSTLTLAPSSPYARRRHFDDLESGSPHLKRVPKSQKVGEEADGAATVPLEAVEHEWLVKATAGQWSQHLHGLLLSDKNLASKRDFMTGFTVLHWAAKSGNSDMVRKVIGVVEKEGARVNVNAKSYGGYTPLHIAAIHGQEEVIAQLVRDYGAKVNVRDHSGKKPFQYLREGSSFAVRHLLHDPGLHPVTGPSASIKKNPKVAASILSSTSTVLGLLSDDTAFYELTKGLKKPASLNRFLSAATAPRRKLRSRSTFSSYSSLSEAVEEEQEETTTKRRPVSELFFGH